MLLFQTPSVGPSLLARATGYSLAAMALLSVLPVAVAGVASTGAASPPDAAVLARPGGYSGGSVMVSVEVDGRTVHWERNCMVFPSDAGIQQAMTFVLHPSGDGLEADVPGPGADDPCGAPHRATRWHAMHLPEGDFLVGEADLLDLVNLANAGGTTNEVQTAVLRRISGERLGQWPDAHALIPPSWRQFVRAKPLAAHVVAMGPRQAVRHDWVGMPPAPSNFHATVTWRATLRLDRGRADGVFPGMVLYAVDATAVFAASSREPRPRIEGGLDPIVLVERVNEHDSEASMGWNLSPWVNVGGMVYSSARN